MKLRLLLAFIGALLLTFCVSPVASYACEVEPASVHAPAGFICPPMYGDGTASTWPGPGVARNDCVYPWTACEPVAITSHQTGITVIVTPSMWCMCWVGVVGPLGETARIVDLDPPTLAALGLDPARGLWPVRVEPIVLSLPDTRMEQPR